MTGLKAAMDRLQKHWGGTNGEGSPYGSDRQIAADVLAVLAEVNRLRDHLDQTSDGELVIDCEKLYCPKCGSEVRSDYWNCYCDECPNPDDGLAESQPPLPLSYGMVLSKPAEPK